jgi:hypothetical protein
MVAMKSTKNVTDPIPQYKKYFAHRWGICLGNYYISTWRKFNILTIEKKEIWMKNK